MTPLDFLKREPGDNSEATVASRMADAFNKPIRIFIGPGQELEVLSYYYSPEDRCMILDVGDKE